MLMCFRFAGSWISPSEFSQGCDATRDAQVSLPFGLCILPRGRCELLCSRLASGTRGRICYSLRAFLPGAALFF